MNNYRFNISVLLFSFFFLSNSLIADIIQVPQDSPTIQSAINASQNGDTVLVDTGIYYENINFNGKNITLTSKFILELNTDYIMNTIIDGSTTTSVDTGSCVIFDSGETADAILMGFTIQNGTGISYDFGGGPSGIWREGGGIIISYSDPVIKHNVVINNSAEAAPGAQAGGGGGISAMYCSPTITNNVIIENHSRYAAGLVLNFSGGMVANNIVAYNEITGDIGTGGIMVWYEGPSTAFLINNTVVENISLQDAGGISVTGVAATLRNNIVWGNIQSYGNQIVATPESTIEYNNVEDGYAGTGNISENPLFTGLLFLLSPDSPCIDAGNPANMYNDVEDVNNPGYALSPSMGSITNDMGAYGGPNAALQPDFITEILEHNKLMINVFPNPVAENINIRGDFDLLMNASIELVNSKGQSLLLHKGNLSATQMVSMNVSQFPDGIYFLTITTNNQKIVKKIIISH